MGLSRNAKRRLLRAKNQGENVLGGTGGLGQVLQLNSCVRRKGGDDDNEVTPKPE